MANRTLFSSTRGALLPAAVGGGRTNCSAPLEKLPERGECPDLVIMVSDNQSVNAGQDYMVKALRGERRSNPRRSSRTGCPANIVALFDCKNQG
jgi:hypothetical protein